MLVSTLRTLYKRELQKLLAEIEAYRSEASLWIIREDISNSAGNLCLHLMGNLNAFIGATLGSSGYIRDRPAEFSRKNVPVSTLIADLHDTIQAVDTSLSRLTMEDMDQPFPGPTHEGSVTIGHMLIHLAMHLDYHLGQINYHRRLLDGQV